MAQFFKILNKALNHHNYQYVDGLNILTQPFNDDPTASCVAGGFYFTTYEYIHNYYEYGCYLAEIFLPQNDPEFRILHIESEGKWRANKIILGKKYWLGDLSTFRMFNLNIKDMPMIAVCKHGFGNILRWLIDYGANINYSDAMYSASIYGNVNILDILKDTGVTIESPELFVLKWASGSGNTEVLQWWKDSGVKLIYDTQSVEWACCNDKVNVLQWWKDSGLEFKYDKSAIMHAISWKHFKTLQWWKDSGLDLKSCNIDDLLLLG